MTKFKDWVVRPGWKQFAFGLLIAALITALFALLTQGKANAKMCQSNPPPDQVCTVAQFNAYFKAGAYSEAHPSLPYSSAFRTAFMYRVKQHAASHPNYIPCPGTGNLGCVWTKFVRHDSCAVSTMPDTFSADSCRDSKHLRGLLSSPYWKKRGELQNKWTARISFCGTVGVLMLTVAGAPVAAVGIGAGSCLGSKVVP